MEPGEADQFVTLRISGVQLLEKGHVRVLQTFWVNVRHACTQPLRTGRGVQDSGRRVKFFSKPTGSDTVQ